MAKTYVKQWKVPSDSDPDKIYTVKEDTAGKLSCDCPIWIYNRRGDRTCKHTDHLKATLKEDEKVKKPTSYNGYDLGERVTYVKAFESSPTKIVGQSGKIIDFHPSPEYEWVAEVEFQFTDDRVLWRIPMTEEYLIGGAAPIAAETDKDPEELRDDLYSALMG